MASEGQCGGTGIPRRPKAAARGLGPVYLFVVCFDDPENVCAMKYTGGRKRG